MQGGSKLKNGHLFVTHTIIAHSWFEATLVYRPRILSSKQVSCNINRSAAQPAAFFPYFFTSWWRGKKVFTALFPPFWSIHAIYYIRLAVITYLFHPISTSIYCGWCRATAFAVTETILWMEGCPSQPLERNIKHFLTTQNNYPLKVVISLSTDVVQQHLLLLLMMQA